MAAVDYFLKIDGIEGESTDDKHKSEIDVESFSWGVSQTRTAAAGGAGAGRAAFQDLKFTSLVSKASPSLFLKSATGQFIKFAVLTARKSGGELQEEFLKITLSDVLVSSYQTSAEAQPRPPTDAVFRDNANALLIGGGAPSDSVALRYRSAKLTEGPQQRIDLTPAATGILRYDAKTGSVEIVGQEGSTFTVGAADGSVSRAVQEFDVRDLLGLLSGPFPTGKLHIGVTEVREAPSPASGPGGSGEAPQPHMHFDVVMYQPADLALTADDLARRGRRIGSLSLDPRRDPASLDVDLTSVGDGTFGIRLQLRGAPIAAAGRPSRPGVEVEAEDADAEERSARQERAGRNASAAFTLALVYDTA